MAKLEFIEYKQYDIKIVESLLVWNESKSSNIKNLPQILWSDNESWSEANLWALEQLCSSKIDIKTVRSNMSHIYAYAKWLESESLAWWNFPEKESERCLTRFRGVLIRLRNKGELAPSTTSQRMSTIIRFYKWMYAKNIISSKEKMWEDRNFSINITTAFGLEHTMRIASTDLAIPNRTASNTLKLEDGLIPVSYKTMKEIIRLADQYSSEELALMLRIGFFTGLRLGSITDLKVCSLLNATSFANLDWKHLNVGPGARPPVATKFNVTGSVPIPKDLLNDLIEYSYSTRRFKRQILAKPENQDILFLSRYGNTFNGYNSRAINVAMSRLRAKGRLLGFSSINDFNFHRTRVTFATELMKVALEFMPIIDAIQFVKEACLHKDESTTMKYIKFIESSKQMAGISEIFTELFMGLEEEVDE